MIQHVPKRSEVLQLVQTCFEVLKRWRLFGNVERTMTTAKDMQRTCKGHAKIMQRTCKEHAKIMQRTRKKHATNMQHAEHNTILKEHTDNGHHCQTSVCKFGIQLGFLHRGVRDLSQEGRKSNAIVARSSRHGGILHEAQAILSGEESRSLNQANEPQDLEPAKRLSSKSLQTLQMHGTCMDLMEVHDIEFRYCTMMFLLEQVNALQHILSPSNHESLAFRNKLQWRERS